MLNARRNITLIHILTFLQSFRPHEGIMVLYIAAVSGSFTLALSAFAVMRIASAIAEIPSGVWSDFFGRRYTLLAYYFTSLLGMTVLYLAENSLAIMLGMTILGITIALGSGTTIAYVHENLQDLQEEEEFKKVEGLRRALGRYAGVAAGLLGTLIVFNYDMRTAFLVSVLIATITLIALNYL